MLAAQGYGVLALDLRGHGGSDGRSTSAPWKLDEDIDAAVEWLAARADADDTKIALLGVCASAPAVARRSHAPLRERTTRG